MSSLEVGRDPDNVGPEDIDTEDVEENTDDDELSTEHNDLG